MKNQSEEDAMHEAITQRELKETKAELKELRASHDALLEVLSGIYEVKNAVQLRKIKAKIKEVLES